jgi:hypothetical protein
MITEARGACFLVASLVLFLLILGMMALGTVMRPSRWSERPKPVR